MHIRLRFPSPLLTHICSEQTRNLILLTTLPPLNHCSNDTSKILGGFVNTGAGTTARSLAELYSRNNDSWLGAYMFTFLQPPRTHGHR